VGAASVAERDIARADDLANAVIGDVAIRCFFTTEEELAPLALRRKPKVSENIRSFQIASST
jgi:alanyl-tRNA synthetase